MNKISRRSFLRGASGAAITIPLATPTLVAWFSKWFDSKRFWDYGRSSKHGFIPDKYGSYHIVYENGLFIVVGPGGERYVSEDGITWNSKGEMEISGVRIDPPHEIIVPMQ